MQKTNNNSEKVILFIDDRVICHTVANLVIPNYTGYKLIGAYSGKEALEIAQKNIHNIGLIISDILLPDISGYEIYDTLYQDTRFCNIPFILQSGTSEKEEIVRKHLPNHVKILRKPYSNKELTDIVNKNMQKHILNDLA